MKILYIGGTGEISFVNLDVTIAGQGRAGKPGKLGHFFERCLGS